MTTAEIAPKKWGEFCARIQEFCRGALVLVAIQVEQPDGTFSTAVRDASLVSMALDDKSDPCSNNLVIEAGQPGGRPCRHVVVEPIRILLKCQAGEDRFHHVEILAENGTTIIAFHPGLEAELLKVSA